MKHTKILVQVLLSLFFLTMLSCEEERSVGRLLIGITDDPFPIEIIEEASINVFRIEAHPKDAEEDLEMVTLSEDTVLYNLINLRNGVVESLVDIEVDAGEYDYFRMYVDMAYLKIIDGDRFDIKVPGGSTSGIKVKVDPSVLVEGGLTTELLLDIDLSKSFVLNGNYSTPAGIKGFNFKPVIRAINLSEAGRVSGFVKDSDSNPINAVEVWTEFDSETYSTFSDSTGFYSIIGIPTGVHTLFAQKEGYNLLTLENVVVIAANSTTRNLTMIKN